MLTLIGGSQSTSSVNFVGGEIPLTIFEIMKRTEKTLQVINDIISSLDDNGLTFVMASDKEAVNFRQRIYNFRNAALKADKDQNLIKKLKIVKIALDKETVHITLGMPDYLDQIKI